MAGRGDQDRKATELFEDLRWLPPVATPEDLPTEDVREGHMCFVSGAKAIYEFKSGEWVVSQSAKGA